MLQPIINPLKGKTTCVSKEVTTAHIVFSVISQLDAQSFCFTISLFHASICFEHMCSSLGGQNSIRQPLVSSHLVHETVIYRCDDTRSCVIQFWPPDDEHMCSKHVEAWNKLIVKQKFCASSWLITEINILRCSTVSKTSKKVSRGFLFNITRVLHLKILY